MTDVATDLSPILKRRLREFVNRDAEMQRFCQLLERPDRFIMLVSGEGGSGKSSLVARMMHECAVRRIRRAEVVWSDTRAYDYMGVMRKIRDDLRAPDAFAPFNDLINFYTEPQYRLRLDVGGPSSIQVAEGAAISGSTTGDIIGMNVVIKDSMITVPRADMAVPDQERMLGLTARFLENLHAVTREGLLVVFMDATEKMSRHTESWLWDELLAAGRDGAISNLLVVLCGQGRRTLGRDWDGCTEISEMKPLSAEHIADYLDRRGVGDASNRPQLARMLLCATQGKALEVATLVDKFVNSMRAS
jgi:hypothetical protein